MLRYRCFSCGEDPCILTFAPEDGDDENWGKPDICPFVGNKKKEICFWEKFDSDEKPETP